jgi:hypothetical protein
MRKLIGLLAVISIAGVAPAFATDPPPATTTSDTASTPAKTEPSADAKATTTTTTKPVDGQVKLVAGDSEADKQLKRLKAAGYKPEVHGGEVVFCRKEAILGSRFEKKMCNSAENLEQQMNNAQEMASQAQRNSTISPRGN